MDSNVFRIRFSGKCLPGFDELFVRQTLRNRLGFTQHQISSVFRGRPVTLKRNMEERSARQYEARLRQIGMDVICEPEEPARDSHPAVPATPPPAMARAPEPPAAPPRSANIPLQIDEVHPAPTTKQSPEPVRPTMVQARQISDTQPAPLSAVVVQARPAARQAAEPPSLAQPQTAVSPAPAPTPSGEESTGMPGTFSRPQPPRHPIPQILIQEPEPDPEPPPIQPETEFLSTILADEDRLADHSTDRRDFFSLSFTGRMHALHYIWLMGITYLLICLTNVSDLLWRLSPHGSQVATPPSPIWFVITLVLLAQTARLSVLRLHDLDRNGLWAGGFIAIYLLVGLFGSTRFANIILQFSIVSLAVPLGRRFPNRYGGRPESPENLLGWFDPGRRCHRNYFLARSIGLINAGIIAATLAGALAACCEFILHLAGIDKVLTAHVLLSMVPTLCVMGLSIYLRIAIARLHDLDFQGSWLVPYIAIIWMLYILMMIPNLDIGIVAGILINLVTILVFVILCLATGNPGTNHFGKAAKIPPLDDLWNGIIVLVPLCCIGAAIAFIWFRDSISF